MASTSEPNLVVETRVRGVKEVRFARPDLRPQLDTVGPIDDCELFQELCTAALNDLAAGEVLVLDLGCLQTFSSACLNFLLRVRQLVRERRARLVLRNVRKEQQEIFEVTDTFALFESIPPVRWWPT
jgi:anti-anti-sigma factor